MELITSTGIDAAPAGVLLTGIWNELPDEPSRPALRAAGSKWVDDRDDGTATSGDGGVGSHVGNHGGGQTGTQGNPDPGESDDHDTGPPDLPNPGGN